MNPHYMNSILEEQDESFTEDQEDSEAESMPEDEDNSPRESPTKKSSKIEASIQ